MYNILVVDDTEINLLMIKRFLDGMPVSVDTADGGEEALRLLDQKKYDICIFDYQMPGMSGVELLNAMKAQKNDNHDVPVIAMTGTEDENAAGFFTDLGFDSFLERDYDVMFKPVDGACGIGIIHLRSMSGKLVVKGQEISIEYLKDKLGKGRYIIQQFINNQHEGISRLYPDACNTLRITVAREGDGTRVLGRMCMLGAHGTDCSNWHFGGVSVNLKEDGTLDKYGYCKIDKKVTAHPDTGVTFEGYKIPYFEEAIALARKATECFYGFCSIGWDIALTEAGPTIIEGNDDWGIVAHQMVEDRGWRQNWEQSHGKLKI